MEKIPYCLQSELISFWNIEVFLLGDSVRCWLPEIHFATYQRDEGQSLRLPILWSPLVQGERTGAEPLWNMSAWTKSLAKESGYTPFAVVYTVDSYIKFCRKGAVP